MKENVPKIVVYFLLAFFFLTLWGYRNGNIGMSERAMRKENGDYTHDGYTVTGKIGDSMAVFLQYNADQTECDVDIYVKRKGSVGWFFATAEPVLPFPGRSIISTEWKLRGMKNMRW